MIDNKNTNEHMGYERYMWFMKQNAKNVQENVNMHDM